MTVLQDIEDRLVHFLRESPNIVKLIGCLADPFQDTQDVIEWILDHLSIDTAEGELLDFLGEMIGVGRPPRQETALFELCNLGDCPDDPDNEHGFENDDDATVTTGGYFASIFGTPYQADPTAQMSDADFRYFIRQKAATLRTKATHENLFAYILAFGDRCQVTSPAVRQVTITQYNYNHLSDWARNYIHTRGFKPAGISIQIAENLAETTL